jgi:antitoxin ParD1/3/4
MNITLTPEQAAAVQRKLQSDRYQDVDELLVQAFELLDEWEEQDLTQDPAWIVATSQKVDEATKSLAINGGSDGETVVNQLLEQFSQARKMQH